MPRGSGPGRHPMKSTTTILREPPRLKALFEDSRLGLGRQMVAAAIAKTGHRDAARALVERIDESLLTAHVVRGLRLLRASEFCAQIKPLAKSSSALVRREAEKALETLGCS